MPEINQTKRSFSELQQMYKDGDNAGLKQYLCKVTGRKYCRFCGDFHEATWTKHPIAMLRETIAIYMFWGR